MSSHSPHLVGMEIRDPPGRTRLAPSPSCYIYGECWMQMGKPLPLEGGAEVRIKDNFLGGTV